MGTFQGHILPGAFFLGFGVWWTTQIPRRYLSCRKQGIAFYSSSIYPCCCRRSCGKCPMEAIVKIVATSVGVVLELFASTDYGKGPGIVYIDDLQHVTMYLFFLISGIIDLLVWRGVVGVANLEYLAAALAFAVEAMLFYHHLHERSQLDILVHYLLLYAIAGCVLSTLVEMHYRSSLAAALARPFCVILQGTWFVQAGFILYNPLSRSHWDGNNHRQMTLVTLMFAWHIAGVAIGMALITLLSRQCIKQYCPIQRGENYEMMAWPSGVDLDLEDHDSLASSDVELQDHGSQTNLFNGDMTSSQDQISNKS